MVPTRACGIQRDGFLCSTTRYGFARPCRDEEIGHPLPLYERSYTGCCKRISENLPSTHSGEKRKVPVQTARSAWHASPKQVAACYEKKLTEHGYKKVKRFPCK